MIQRKSPVELRVRQDIFSSTSSVAAHFTERMHVQFNWGRISRSKIEGYRARQAPRGRLAVNFRDRREPPGWCPAGHLDVLPDGEPVDIRECATCGSQRRAVTFPIRAKGA